jgi:hypothetical protein
MQTPADQVRAIRALRAAASDRTQAALSIQPDGSFALPVLMVQASGA